MRSLHAIQSLNNRLGGAVHAGLNVCRYLVEAGHPAQVFSTRGQGDDLDYLSSTFACVPCHMVSRIPPARWFNGRGMSSWLEANVGKYDIVELHAVFSFVTIRAAHACRRHGVPYLLRPHGSLDPFDLVKRAVAKRMLGPIFVRPVLAGAAGVVCTTQREADLVETYGARTKKIVVPLPVPPLSPEIGSRSVFRAKHGIPEDAFVILFLSRIDYKKGLEFLLNSVAALRHLHKDLWLVIAGDGEKTFVEGIRSKVNELGLGSFTREIGFVSGAEKAAAFKASDLFALPSLNENFGMVIVEAMQSGIPVLVSDQVYIHPEIISFGAGALCKPQTEDCKRALMELLMDRNVIRAMGKCATRLASDRFSPQASTKLLLDVYGRTVGQARVLREQ